MCSRRFIVFRIRGRRMFHYLALAMGSQEMHYTLLLCCPSSLELANLLPDG